MSQPPASVSLSSTKRYVVIGAGLLLAAGITVLALTRHRNGRCSSDRTAARRRRAASLNGSNQSAVIAATATASAAAVSSTTVSASPTTNSGAAAAVGVCDDGCCPGHEHPALTLTFRTATSADLPDVHRMEAASYPPDEAASLSSLTYRCQNAQPFFLLAFGKPVNAAADVNEELVGFVCGTLTSSPTLTHDTMFEHDPKGNYLCIHSVVVSEHHRRYGIGTRLMQAYILHVRSVAQVSSILLIAKKHLVAFYTGPGVGFTLNGPSNVVHGADQWYECGLSLRPSLSSTSAAPTGSHTSGTTLSPTH